jgi:capsule polysaccharide export protein KpsE/RkpR
MQTAANQAAATQPRASTSLFSNINPEELAWAVLRRWKMLGIAALATGVLAVGVSFLVPKTYLSTTTFLPPQQQQGAAAAALSSLGALAGIAGGGAVKTPGDQYVAFMQSVTLKDRIIERFKLMDVYDVKLKQDAREKLAKFSKVGLGKKDGLITVTIEDVDADRAAAIANRYVDELRLLSDSLAITEAQQRRVFFEAQWKQAKEHLVTAQQALQQSGFNASALKAEPKAAAEAYAQLRAELSSAEIKLRVLRTSLADGAPEVRQLVTVVQSLRDRVGKLEASESADERNADYVGKFREYKYQETMFELMAKQYELARVDEAREGALIQVLDIATPAEKKASPKRSVYGLVGAIIGLLLCAIWVTARTLRQSASRVANRAE